MINTQLNVRLPEPTIRKINWLSKIYGSQAKVIIAAIENLSKEIEMKRNDTLQDITGYESGAVLYEDGASIWIGNWAGIEGLPREFVTGTLGLGDDLSVAKVCATPEIVKQAMKDHEQDQGTEISKTGFRSWKIGDVIVTINRNWN